jgi:hypothetical protein
VRITLDIAEDVLLAVKQRARREGRSLGEVLSELARQALTLPPAADKRAEEPSFYGLEPLPRRGQAVSNDLIDRLREEDVE